MGLKQRLQADLQDALRSHDERRKSVIRIALAEIAHAEVAQEGDLGDARLVALLRKQANQRQETIEELRQTERADSLAEEEAKLAVLETYLPDLLSREEIVEEAGRVIAQLGATGMGQMGQVMRSLMSELKGRADGRVVNEVVRELLSG